MSVLVMYIRRMCVGVNHRLVRMPVAVAIALWHDRMRVCVMPVIVAMGMLMRHRVVRVQMFMAFGQMQHHARQHEPAAQRHQPASRTLAQRKGHGSADERSERKYRSRARSAKSALRQQIQAKAQAIASGAHGQQTERSTSGGPRLCGHHSQRGRGCSPQ